MSSDVHDADDRGNPRTGANHPLSAPFSYHRGETGCLLLHGFTGTPWALKNLGETLANHNLTVEAPLLSGHGTLPEDMDHVSWERWVCEAHLSLERLQKRCQKLFVMGLSMGGTLALFLASEKNVHGVVTLATPVRMRRLASRLVPVAKPFIRSWKKRRDRSVRWIPEMGYDCYPLSGAGEFFKLMRETRKRLPDVRCPLLILHARGDRTVPVRNADLIYREIGSESKKIMILPASSHTITRGENQKDVEDAILAFVCNGSKRRDGGGGC